ncbi:Zn(2)-C6 fungal-type domain-containing protein [Fusarium sp. LHS14.1]|nr:Zn(2)-C6 fungal-type domain-containing protein [Fusarium sp. LHS14.1]
MENSLADLGSSLISGGMSDRPRKRMRKGTRSCTECRRRKIRCIFPPSSSVCSHCSTRGSTCIDQNEGVDTTENVSPTKPQTSTPSSTSRRRPRVQSLPRASSRQGDLTARHALVSDEETSDIETPSDHPPPLIAVFDDTQIDAPMPSSRCSRLTQVVAHKAKICGTIRSALPSYDEITATLAKNGSWWDSFRQKTRAISQSEPLEPLLSFAAHAYTSTSPAELAILAVAYARSLGQGHKIFTLVDTLIIGDFALAATLDGMECLVLLAKTYTDLGQPRRAWFTWRKGLAIAQMMGMHRLSPAGPAMRQRIWWAIYHGDRFTSLLLGLPHGFNDALIDTSGPKDVDQTSSEVWVPIFIHKCAVTAGEVINYLISPGKPSFAKAMSLDEEMDAIYHLVPQNWWDIPEKLPSSRIELNNLVDRLLIHFFFFHIRMYIHLPFLKHSSSSVSREVSRLACTDAARQLVKCFLVLHAKVDGVSLFDCKTSDFVAFTAAVVLLIGNPVSSDRFRPEDLQLVADSQRIFQASEEEGCKMASQCRRALALLSSPPQHGGSTQEIPIPYFGRIVRRVPEQSSRVGDERAASAYPQLTPSTTGASSFDAHSTWGSAYSLDYMGFTPGLAIDEMWGFGGIPENDAMSPFGLDVGMMDIDQDWSLFLPSTNA